MWPLWMMIRQLVHHKLLPPTHISSNHMREFKPDSLPWPPTMSPLTSAPPSSVLFLNPLESHLINREHSFPFDTRSCAKASLPNGETFNMLLDTGASRSYLSYGFYLECEYLKKLPTFKPLGPHVYMGNGEWVPVIHIIPIVFHVGNCAFEVYTLVCKMTSSDFIWGMKNVVETEGVICTRSMTYKFLNRSPKLLAKNPVHLPADGSKHDIDL